MNYLNYDGTRHYDPKEQLSWRLEWLDKQIKKREERGEKISKEQKRKWLLEEQQSYQNALKDYEVIKKLEKDTCILVSTHYYHAPWLRACLESCRKTALYIILAYDNPIWSEKQRIEKRFPNSKTLKLVDYISIKHKTWGSGVGIPHSWNLWYGMRAVESLGFKYVFNINGDCVMEKPEGLLKLREMLGNADAISCEYVKGRYFGTMAYLGKTEVIKNLWDMNMERLYQFNIGNAEGRLGRFSEQLGLKIVPVENPEDHHFKPPGTRGTFRKVLGFRHLHAEHKVRRWNRMKPIEMKYCEVEYLNDFERKTLLRYWNGEGEKFLNSWWNH